MDSLRTAAARARHGDWARLLRVVVPAAVDTGSVTAAAATAFAVWAGGKLGQPAAIYLPLAPALALVPLANAASGLYPGLGLGPVELLRRQWRNASGVFLALMAATFAFKVGHAYSRMTLALTWLGALALLPLARSAASRLFARRSWWLEPAIVVGGGPRAASLARQLHKRAHVGYRPVALLAEASGSRPANENAKVPTFPVEQAPSFAAAGVTVALIAEQDATARRAMASWLQQFFAHVIVLGDATDFPVEHVEMRNIGGVLGVEYTNQLLWPRNRLIKRALDFTLGTAGLLVALPVIGLAAVLVKLSSRGPAFFSQEREGLGGARIRVPKLRTMFVDAEERLRAHLDADPAARQEWESGFKLARDPRVIPGVGAFLRRTSIDELPQLWSVVRGRMSLVGPRPFPDYHLQRFPEAFLALRRRVHPGLTGLWQVTVRSEGGIEEQQAYDTYYIQNWSVWMDAYVLARTVGAVVARRGAY